MLIGSIHQARDHIRDLEADRRELVRALSELIDWANGGELMSTPDPTIDKVTLILDKHREK